MKLNMEGVTGEAAKCQFCCDGGWVSYDRPMADKDGRTVMVRIPSRCICKAGQKFDQTIQVVSKS